MKIAHKYSASALLICLLFFLSTLAFYGGHKWLVVKEIQLTLKKAPVWEGSRNEIHALLSKKLKPFIGKRLWQVSLNDLMQVVVSEPQVGEVQILRRFPNRFFIQIKPRKPLLVLLHPDSGKIHPLSMDGQALAPLPLEQIPNLPILRGAVFFKQSKIRKQAIRFVSLMPDEGVFSRQEISEIQYSAPEKSLTFILSKTGRPIKVGYDPTPIKNKRIDSVLRYLGQKNIKWRVIDARFSQKIVVSTGQAI